MIKKILTAALFLAAYLTASSQTNIYVWQKDGTVTSFPISNVDSISFTPKSTNSGTSTTKDAMPSDAKTLAAKMYMGINLGNTFESVKSGGSSNETSWGSPVITKSLIDFYKASGFNAIRLPVAWHIHESNTSTYEIDAAWMKRIKEVVDYCYQDSLYVIINIHWDGGWLENNVTSAKQTAVNAEQAALWKQIATQFKDYDEHVLFASCNEPGMNQNDDASTIAPILKSYHQTFVNTVRATGGNNAKRCLIVQGITADIDKSLANDVVPTDNVQNRMMYEVHDYPYTYAIMTEDASWGNMDYYWGKDYQNIYINGVERSCTWSTETTMANDFNKMKSTFVNGKGMPVILGEFAVTDRPVLTGNDLTKFEASRAYYYEYIVKTAKNYGMVPFLWDTPGHVMDRSNNKILNQTSYDGLMKGAKEGKYPF
jgi:endoglucanase